MLNRFRLTGCIQASGIALLALSLFMVSPMVNGAVTGVTVDIPTTVRQLPGALDNVQMLNSNSPEVIQTEGILVSTMSPDGKSFPDAHLNHRFLKRFNVFAHHIAKADAAGDLTTLYLGIVLHNPNARTAKVDVVEGASYLSQPDAPFMPLASTIDNAEGSVFAGPGDRVMNDVLRHKLQEAAFPRSLEVPARTSRLLTALPIPVKELTPPLNGRSLLAALNANSPVQVATLAMFARKNADGTERAPIEEEWVALLNSGQLAGPRDKKASDPNAAGPIIYGRVAGVQQGTTWNSEIAGSVPELGRSYTFPISSVPAGTFGSQQVQSAKLLKRYPDTAYAAHGNYGVKYDITIPMVNTQKRDLLVLVKLQTPLKKDEKFNCITFNKEQSQRVFFRGTIKSSYVDSQKIRHEKYTHLVQRQGEQGVPLVAQYLKPNEKRTVNIEFLYPPDATPPQVLTIESADPDSLLD